MLEAKLRFVPRNSLWLPNSDSANSLHLNPVLSQLIFCLLLVDKLPLPEGTVAIA
jgi:hypothetical protein